MDEKQSLLEAKAKAYETTIGALSHIVDSCDQSFCDKAGIKKFAQKKLDEANKTFKEHLKRFPD